MRPIALLVTLSLFACKDDAPTVAPIESDTDASSIEGEAHFVGLTLPPGTAAMRFVLLPAGDFEMGCKVGRDDVAGGSCTNIVDGAGLHDVTFTGGLWMQDTEVTQAQWAALSPRRPTPSDFTGDDRPVETVSWHDAAWYANALSVEEGLSTCYTCVGGFGADDAVDPVCSLVGSPYACEGYRLPTEAEWEYAARGGESFPYAGSDDPLDVAWYSGNISPSGTGEVGQKLANGFGLYDMSGNVWEWTGDWWAAPYDTAAVINPEGPESGPHPVLRGGAIIGSALHVRVARRNGESPGNRDNIHGFRLCRSAP